MTAPEQRPVEATELHTGILRCTLAVDESQMYWSRFDPSEDPTRRNLRAFEERWFGSRSQARVKSLLASLSVRFDAHPKAIELLRGWRGMSPVTRKVVCHWHLQFVDPLYRRFSSDFLPSRREGARDTIDRDVIGRWVDAQAPGRWAASTRAAFGTKLLTTAVEAGLVQARGASRYLALPRVEDDALKYLLRWLGTVQYTGTLVDNAYLASVGLVGRAVDERLLAIPGLLFRRSGDVVEFEWHVPWTASMEGVSP